MSLCLQNYKKNGIFESLGQTNNFQKFRFVNVITWLSEGFERL